MVIVTTRETMRAALLNNLRILRAGFGDEHRGIEKAIEKLEECLCGCVSIDGKPLTCLCAPLCDCAEKQCRWCFRGEQ